MSVKPKDVRSPKEHWTLIDVVLERQDWSLALGEWDGGRCLAARWNGDDDRPKGNPVSHGMPTWFVLPNELVDPLLAADLIPPEKRGLVRALLGLSASERFDPGDLPAHDLGPWPEGLSLRREDIYGEEGR
jgi:hypothetical protein